MVGGRWYRGECQGVRVSKCQGVKVSGCQSVRVSKCQGVKVSECQIKKKPSGKGIPPRVLSCHQQT
ncbi:MAG: hypothetical protein COS84_04100 [Armatimonadetes bacterium CG07_land_8_20_14_0_80_40_9]|nr:MAG: hypothetical protein COS84_04100 [Armatimonadetes bacterium CG07_land_8_20_14_0_80_40_9]